MTPSPVLTTVHGTARELANGIPRASWRSAACAVLVLTSAACSDDERANRPTPTESDVTTGATDSDSASDGDDSPAANETEQTEPVAPGQDTDAADAGSEEPDPEPASPGVDASVPNGPGAPLNPDDVETAVFAPIEASAAVCASSDWSEPVAVETPPTRTFDRLLSVSSDGQSWLFEATAETPGHSPDAGALDAGAAEAAPGKEYFIVDLPDGVTEVTVPSDYDLTRGAALSADGRRLVVVQGVPNIMGVFTRNEQGSAFGEPDASAFLRLQNVALQTGYAYEMPAFSASAEHLYVSYRVGAEHRIQRLLSDGTYWNVDRMLSDLQERLENPAQTTLTSASTDGRTLFMWDAADEAVLVAHFSHLDEPSGSVERLALPAPVFVDAECGRLWTLDAEGRPAVSTPD